MDFEALEKLADLKQKGIITEEEFNIKKKEILNIQGTSGNLKRNDSDLDKQPSENIKVSLYYQKEFELIKNSNETYKGKFNWNAFTFNFFWYATKGMMKQAIIIPTIHLIWIIIPPVGVMIFLVLFGSFDYRTFKIFTTEFEATFGIDFYNLWFGFYVLGIFSSSLSCGTEATYKYYSFIYKEKGEFFKL